MGASAADAEAAARAVPAVAKFLDGAAVKKIIHVPDRILNFIVAGGPGGGGGGKKQQGGG